MTMYRAPAGDSHVFGAPGVPGVSPGNKGAFAQFSRVPVKNLMLSDRAGSDIFQEEIHVRILMPGDPLSIPQRRVKLADGQIVGQEWIDGFPKEWAAFESGVEQMPDGTPLSEWPRCTVSLKATLNSIHIFTVEQLATANEAALERVGMGARKLQAEARAFVEVRDNTAASMRLAAEAETARQAMVEMTDRMQEMQRQLDMLTRAGKVMIGNAVEPAPVAAPAVALDPMSAAAMASGAKPLTDADVQQIAPRRGRPPNPR
jgi:hypothetical protein